MRIIAICLLLWASGMWASAAALEGIVRTPKGRPISNAQLRIEAKSGKFVKTTTTDARGTLLLRWPDSWHRLQSDGCQGIN